MGIQTNSLLHLIGKTQKGKNRVREHGDIWKVKAVQENVSCISGAAGLFIFPKRDKDSSDNCRWVKAENDEDFDIRKINGVISLRG